MQKLHLVGFTPDHDGLILSARKGAKSGKFVVSVDTATLERLVEGSRAQASAVPAARTNGRRDPDERPSRPDSALGPREMQELLRGGWSLEEVAREARVDVEWVSRFAAPVMAEIRRVLDRAIECTFEKPRVGMSALALGPAVRRNAAERGVRFTDEDFDAAWSAAQMYDDVWLIGFDYLSRGRVQSAEWVLDLEVGELTSNNRLGTQLGFVQSARRRIDTTPPAKSKPKATASARPASKKAPARRATAKKKAAAKKTAARPRSRASGTAKRTTARKGTSRAKKKARGADQPVEMAAAMPATPASSTPRHDPWREELRRRELERSAALAARVEAVPPPPAPPARPVPQTPPPRVAVIAPTVRLLRRSHRPPPTVEPEAIDDEIDVPDEVDELDEPAHTMGPLPAPAPVALPDDARKRAAEPLGLFDEDDDEAEEDDDDLDLQFEADDEEPEPDDEPEPDVAPPPAPAPRRASPVFHGAQAAAAVPVRRRRRTEPLRAR